MSRIRPRLTFANVVSVLALFVALGGSATAAVLITGKNVKDGTLTGKDIKNNSVGSVDVKDGNLLAKDFKPGQLPQGVPGQKGDKGDQGVQGVQGVKGDKGDPGTNGTNAATNTVTRRNSVSTANGTIAGVTASCDPGETATGGGGFVGASTGSAATQIIASAPGDGFGSFSVPPGTAAHAWTVYAYNGTGATQNVYAWVLCASP